MFRAIFVIQSRVRKLRPTGLILPTDLFCKEFRKLVLLNTLHLFTYIVVCGCFCTRTAELRVTTEIVLSGLSQNMSANT